MITKSLTIQMVFTGIAEQLPTTHRSRRHQPNLQLKHISTSHKPQEKVIRTKKSVQVERRQANNMEQTRP